MRYFLDLVSHKKRELDFSNSLINSSDLDWIQTSNLLSRNQVRYSVAPRGHFETINSLVSGCKYRKIEQTNASILYKKFMIMHLF
jgi:hypothetical protein